MYSLVLLNFTLGVCYLPRASAKHKNTLVGLELKAVQLLAQVVDLRNHGFLLVSQAIKAVIYVVDGDCFELAHGSSFCLIYQGVPVKDAGVFCASI